MAVRPDDVHAVDHVRRSVRCTRGAGTAALRFVPALIQVEPSLGARLEGTGLEGLGKAVRLGRKITSHLPPREVQGPIGRIDFNQDRSLYSEGDDGWTLTAPGLEFVGEPGEWERLVTGDEISVPQIDPLWLVELIGGTVEASNEGTESVLGEACTHYAVVASFSVACQQAVRRLELPDRKEKLDYERLALSVWLDPAGRIRRAIFYGDQMLRVVELCDFGEPGPVELPEPDDILLEETE